MSNSTEMRATAHPPVPAARRTTGQRDDRGVPPCGALAPNSPAAATAAGAFFLATCHLCGRPFASNGADHSRCGLHCEAA